MSTQWAQAACRASDIDSELFFPLSYASDKPQVRYAKSVCWRCPILAICRAYVDANPQDDGIWAGLTPRERRETRAAVNSR